MKILNISQKRIHLQKSDVILHLKAGSKPLGRNLIHLRIKLTRNERPPPHILGSGRTPICSFAHQARLLDSLLYYDRKRNIDPQTGEMPLFGHRTFSLSAPAQATLNFFAREDSLPHFLCCFFLHTPFVFEIRQFKICKAVIATSRNGETTTQQNDKAIVYRPNKCQNV